MKVAFCVFLGLVRHGSDFTYRSPRSASAEVGAKLQTQQKSVRFEKHPKLSVTWRVGFNIVPGLGGLMRWSLYSGSCNGY